MNNFDNDIPAGIRALVSAAAADTPGRSHDLTRIHQRARALRHRRSITAAALAVLVVVVPMSWMLQGEPSAVEPPLASHSRSSSPSPSPSLAGTWPGASRQRMIGLISWGDFPAVKQYAEILPHGTIKKITLPEGLILDADDRIGPGPDASLALLATQNPPRDVEPCPLETVKYLIRMDHSARQTFRADLRWDCHERLRFIGADGTHAYLLRNRTVVAYNLITKAERKLFDTARLVWLDFDGEVIVAIEPKGVSTTDTQQCAQMGATIRTYHVATATIVTGHEGTINVCDHIESAKASPDGTRVAFLDDDNGDGFIDLKVVDIGTGVILATRRVSDERHPIITAAVWSDLSTVWMVTHPRDGDPVSLLVTVPG